MVALTFSALYILQQCYWMQTNLKLLSLLFILSNHTSAAKKGLCSEVERGQHRDRLRIITIYLRPLLLIPFIKLRGNYKNEGGTTQLRLTASLLGLPFAPSLM